MRKLTILLAVVMCLGESIVVNAKDYKAAEIYTNESYLYGRFEFSMICSDVSGVLSTFFLYKNGSEQSGVYWNEIDIEVFGKNKAASWQSNIITGTSANRLMTEAVHTANPGFAAAYHKFTLEWMPDTVRWLVDDVMVRVLTGQSYEEVKKLRSPMSIRFNIWSSESTGWAGTFENTKLPTFQNVKFISYSSYDTINNTFSHQWTDEFDTWNSSRWSKANWTFGGNRCDFNPANAQVANGELVLSLTGPPTDIDYQTSLFGVNIYPNPCTNVFILESPFVSSLEIYDIKGVKVKSQRLNIGTNTVQVGQLRGGVYIIKLNTSGETKTIRLNKF